MKRILTLTVLVFITACGGSEEQEYTLSETPSMSTEASEPQIYDLPIKQYLSKYKIALVGNSHTHGVIEVLEKVIRKYNPQSEVELKALGFGFTEELIKNTQIVDELKNGGWTHLIIQGQKYSQSGSREYSTAGTEEFISLAKSLEIMPILFSEHPQNADKAEAERVFEMYKKIVEKQPSCIAPVGLAWIAAIDQVGYDNFYSSDANHAASYGLMTTSLVLSEVITGEIVNIDMSEITKTVPEDIQLKLAEIVSDTIIKNPPCS